LKFLLGNLYDFQPDKHRIENEDLATKVADNANSQEENNLQETEADLGPDEDKPDIEFEPQSSNRAETRKGNKLCKVIKPIYELETVYTGEK